MVIKVFAVIISWMMVIVPAQAAPEIEQWQTANGAHVFFVAAPELPMIDIRVVFDAGAARDGDLPGVSLMTNSILSEGAGELDANQIAATFDNVGAQFGTSSERDMAVLSLRSLTDSTALNSALEMFSTVLNTPSFPEDAFKRQQKQRLISLKAEKQSPGALAARNFYKNVYNDHPYANMPVGDESSINKLSLDALKVFYQQYYVGKNATIAIVGAVDNRQAKKIAEKLMNKLPAGSPAKQLPTVAEIKQAKIKSINHPSTQTHILMGQPGMKRGDIDYFPLYVGNHILGGSGLVSQLSNEIREKRGLSYSVYSYFRPMHEMGPYQFGLQTRNDQAQQALEIMQNTLEVFIKNGPSEKELKAAKQNITGGFALRVDSNSKIVDYLSMIGFYKLPLDYLDSFTVKVNAVTIEQIKDAYTRRVHPDRMVTVLVGGEAE